MQLACGITAACLLRKVSKRPEVDPITAREMMSNADNLEELATNIQLMALKDDQQTAQTALVNASCHLEGYVDH